jgi:hypothetical protein
MIIKVTNIIENIYNAMKYFKFHIILYVIMISANNESNYRIKILHFLYINN